MIEETQKNLDESKQQAQELQQIVDKIEKGPKYSGLNDQRETDLEI